MDGAMRDLERMREEQGGGGRALLVILAALTVAAVAVSLSMQAGLFARSEPVEVDPLDALLLESSEAAARADESALPEVDRLALTFPERLSNAPPSARPELEAAVAAASAERRHLDPLDEAAVEERLPAVLPAAIAAGSTRLAASAPHDPALMEAIPQATVGETAPEGHDGEYTVQVISYDSPEGAHAFAAGLRARGHRAFVLRADVAERGTVYRVRIGPFERMSEAASYRRQFEETERMNTIVVRRR